MVTIYRRQTICKANVERQKEPSVNTEKEQQVWRRSRKRRVKGQDDGETERQGGAAYDWSSTEVDDRPLSVRLTQREQGPAICSKVNGKETRWGGEM